MRKPSLHECTGRLAWEDLRTVLAVVRGGSLAAAARALGLEHSTVFRRVEDVERRLGARLFERERGAYVANAHAEALADTAREIEAAVLEAERRVLGADARLEGAIRIATSEVLGAFLLPCLLRDFADAHPGIELTVSASNRYVDLARREADLALRAAPSPPEDLVARPLARIRYAVYLQDARWRALGAPTALDALPWLGFDAQVAHLEVARWMARALPGVAPRLRFDSIMTLLRAAEAGAGAAVLPMFAAAQVPALVRVSDPLPDLEMPVWLLTHPDVRGNARVRALGAHLLAHMPARVAALLDGGACAATPLPCPPDGARRGARPRRGPARPPR